MAATPTPFCSQCGTPLQGNTRFCTNCGATIETGASSPTIAASQASITPPPGEIRPGQARFPGPNRSNTEISPSNSFPSGSSYTNNPKSFVPPPPPPTIYNPYTNNPQGGSQSYQQTTMPDAMRPVVPVPPVPQTGAYQVPAYAQKPKGNRGCATTSIILLLVLALGIGGYFLFHTLAAKNTSGNNTGTSSTSTTRTSNSTTTTQGSTPTVGSNAGTTEQLNLQITYANVDITLISAQLANSFSDDTSTTAGSAGIVRVNLRENNTTTSNPDYIEGDSMLLLLPGGTTTQPDNAQENVSPAQGVNRLNWLDFPLNVQATLSQLTLRIGKQSENQMDVPLQAKANLSKYQDKTSNPGTQFKYGPLNMTLKTTTLSYNYDDQQATTGNLYVVLTLAAVNNTSNTEYLEPSSNMRLQAGGNSVQPDSTATLPPTVNASTTVSGIVAFLVPQNATTFTLVMLAQPDASPAINQATQSFQIQ